ncbi:MULTISPECIES: DUF924 family protein [Pseudomonas]|uniref:DUF924 family protein n=1 Tax=Pseudomonas TaxID=286 RepID=UPI001CFB3FB7|nr:MULTISPECIES: DUF924 family protein [Pseudomonas]
MANGQSATMDHQAVIDFWLAAGRERWFAKDLQFDDAFRQRFIDLHLAAARRELEAWLDAPDSALALLILLDQFPRNAFRDTAHMFATDALACHYARQVVDAGLDEQVEPDLRQFFYLPLEHSERLADQNLSVAFNRGISAETLHHAELHRDVIARFGRFPHRNRLLGRESSSEELAFLDAGGFAG